MQLPFNLDSVITYLDDKSDGFGVVLGVLGGLGAVAAFIITTRYQVKANKNSEIQKEENAKEISAAIQNVQDTVTNLSESIYSDTRNAITEIFEEIVGRLDYEIGVLKDLLRKIQASIEELRAELAAEEEKSPRFTAKIERVKGEIDALEAASEEAHKSIVQLEEDRQLAGNIAKDMLNKRWENAVVAAQYGRLEALLSKIERGPVRRAAEMAAKNARLAEGKKERELRHLLAEKSEYQQSSELQLPLSGDKENQVRLREQESEKK